MRIATGKQSSTCATLERCAQWKRHYIWGREERPEGLTLQWNLFPNGLHFFQEGGASGL